MAKPGSVDTPQTRTLGLAARTLGGFDKLAAALDVDLERLVRWSSGEESAPNEVFLRALDIVAAGRAHKAAERSQALADRAQAAATRAQAVADRQQATADRMRRSADQRDQRLRARTQHFRPVESPDGEQASNTTQESDQPTRRTKPE